LPKDTLLIGSEMLAAEPVSTTKSVAMTTARAENVRTVRGCRRSGLGAAYLRRRCACSGFVTPSPETTPIPQAKSTRHLAAAQRPCQGNHVNHQGAGSRLGVSEDPDLTIRRHRARHFSVRDDGRVDVFLFL
jgi:hypothetical protein